MIAVSSDAGALDPGALWRRIVSLRGEMAWIVLGQAATAFGGIVGVKLLTHWLPPEAYGQLALGLTVTTLVQQTILSPFTGAGLRFYSAARSAGELGAFLEALKQGLRIAVALIVALALIGMAIVSLKHQASWIPILCWCTAFALFSGFSATLDGMQNAARQRVIVAWHSAIGIWLRFLLGTAVVIVVGARASNALAGYTLAAVVVFGSQFYFFKRRLLSHKTDIPGSVQIEKWRRSIVSYGWPFAAFGIFVWAQSASERWALQIFGDTTQVAQYAVLFQLGYYPITMLGGMLMQLCSPMIFQIAGDGNGVDQVKRARRLSILLAVGALIATVVAAFVARATAEIIFSWIVPPVYLKAAYLLPLMVLSSGILTTGHFACLALMSESSTKPLVAPKIVTAILAIGFNAIGAAQGGLRGVVLASLLFSILYTAWILVLSYGIMLEPSKIP